MITRLQLVLIFLTESWTSFPLLLATYADVICKYKVQTAKQKHAGMSRRRLVIYLIRESTVDSRRALPPLLARGSPKSTQLTLEFSAYSGLFILYMIRGAGSAFLMNARNRIKITETYLPQFRQLISVFGLHIRRLDWASCTVFTRRKSVQN